ncbi:MAG: gliding motility-associated C-terminal domain-containing protein [Bacteroidales bacterium]|nr:gliding motility-associated C-terminal domain-containing protein [Bacteroidales bacterium]
MINHLFSKVVLFLLMFVSCNISLLAQKCIDLGVGIGLDNGEYALIDYFKNNQRWEVADNTGKQWYGCADMNEFKVVNGSYYHYDTDWSCDVNNDAWGEPWDDTYISYWDMMVDQGKIRPDGYPTQIPNSVYRYHTKAEDPAQGVNTSQVVNITQFTRRMYFPQGLPHSGWVLKWEGTGTINFQGLENVVADAGTTSQQTGGSWYPAGYTFSGNDYTFTSNGNGRVVTDLYWMIHGWVLEIVESDPNDPIRNVVMLFPGLEDEYDAGQKFNPQYVERMSQFNSLRYMGYLNSNGIESRRVMADCNPFRYTDMLSWLRWEERTGENWYCLNNGNGGSYEYIIELSNLTKTDPWVNIPYCADEKYTDSLVQLFMEKLDPDLTLYVEVGNELWNFAPEFDGFFWQAAVRVTEYPGLGDFEAHGAHINRIFQRVGEVAGAQNLSRIVRVFAGWPRYTDVNNRTLNYINRDNWDAFATTWYFNLTQSADGDGCVDPATGTNWRSTLYNWWQANQTNQIGFNTMYRDCLLNQFRCTGGFANNSDVVLANYYDKYVVCYEGGNHTMYGCTNGPTGGALDGELNFDNPTYPDYITDNGFVNAIAVADESEQMAEVYEEVIDSLQSAGVKLANHLSFAGSSSCYGVWSFIQPRDLLDPLPDLLAKYPKFRVFSDRIKSSNCTQLEIVLEADSVGAGLSIMLDGFNDYVQPTMTNLPNETANYSFETWIKPTVSDKEQSIFALSNSVGTSALNLLRIREDNKLVWEIFNNGVSVMKLVGNTIVKDTWNQVAVTKNANRYSLYLNGTIVASINATLPSLPKNVFTIGASLSNATGMYFCGEIDEFRYWSVARSQDEIRDFMCKKIPNSYTSFSNLRAYYRFDSPDYINAGVFDRASKSITAQLKNISITARSRYAVSGAALGDESVYLYPSSWTDISLSLRHPDGDMFAVSNLGSGTPDGVHVYLINNTPYYHDVPEYYLGIDTNRTYGVYTTNGTNANYDIHYEYQSNPFALSGISEGNNRLLGREHYGSEFWQHAGALQRLVSKSLDVNCKEQYRGEYCLAYRQAETPVRPGSGMALRNAQVPSGNIDGKILYLDLHDYTVSFWAQGWGEVFNFTGKYSENEQKFSIGPEWEHGLGCSMRTSYNWGNTQYITPNSRIATDDEWKHYTVTRKGTKITIFINGIEAASGNILDAYTINEMHLFNDPQWQTGNYPDGHCGLTIDELQVWDMALDQATIRDWMCKKVTEAHPYECEHLVLYFNFDEGNGSVLEDKRGSSDIVLTTDGSGFQWVRSGAAIGNESVHDYLSPENIQMIHPNGDILTANRTSGSSTGIHLYRIDNMPPVTASTSSASIVNIDSTRYWGMYVVDNYGVVNQQTVIYNYENNTQINLAEEANLRLLSRFDNAASPWLANLTTLPNASSNTIQLTNQAKGEYVIGATTTSALNDYLAPENPVFITETSDTNRTSFCGNETNLIFTVTPDSTATNYVWIVPQFLNGYSNSNTIIVNSSYSGKTIINTTIAVAATNSYGSSDTVFYPIQIVPAPTRADAGPDIILLPPQTSVVLDGNLPLLTETGSWTVSSGNVSFTNNENPNTSVNNIIVGENILQWSISNGVCPASIDSMRLNYAPSPSDIIMADGKVLRLAYCEGQQITIKAVPQEDVSPDSYLWTMPSGMQLVSQNGDEATILIGNGYGGAISVAAVYNGIASPAFVSAAIGISPVPEKPVFVDTPSVLCLNVDQLIAIQYTADKDSVVWTMPFGVYPTVFPKSTTESIEVQGILEVSGYIKAQAYYNACTSVNSADSILVQVRPAPAKPMLYLGTDGGTADAICNNDNAILWVRNYDPSVQYEWQWQTTVDHIRYFGDNNNGAEFTFGNENSNVYVRSVTNAVGCNTSEWYEFYGWARDFNPEEITNLQITNPVAQNALNLTVGQTYTFTVTGTGNLYYWNLPNGFEMVNDGDIYDEVNQIRVIASAAGTLEVFPITQMGCAGNAYELRIAVSGALFPPEYVSGNTTICQSTNLNITVSNVGATEYVWTLPDGTEFVTAVPVLNQIINNAQSGILRVFARTGTNVSTALEINIWINAVALSSTGFVDQYNNPITSVEVCTNDANKPIYHRWSNTNSYIWDIVGSAIQFEPRHEPGHDNDNDYELTNRTSPTDTMMPISWVNWRCRNDGSDGGYLYVTAVNTCGGADVTDSIYYYWAIPMNQQVPEFTSAPTSACVGSSVNYEIKEIPFAQQYIWHVPGGLLVDDIVTTIPSLTASVVNGSGGVVEVYAVSDVCGLSQTTTQYSDPVTIQGEPVGIEFIDAPTAACLGEELTFSVNDIGAGTYNWILPEGLSAVTIDNDDAGAVVSGNWNEENVPNMVNGSALSASNNSTTNSVVFTPEIPRAGLYKVWISYFTSWDTRADVPVTVTHRDGINNMFVNMQVRPEDGIWHELGDFNFNLGTSGSVRIATNASGGSLSVADAVKFELLGMQDDTTITIPVRSAMGGAVCVEAVVPGCASPYRICTDPVNLTGELTTPVFATQETSVCEGMDYLYRISDIGAEAYEWTLPIGMSINGATGTIITGSREVTVSMLTNTGSPVQIAARGIISSCNITSEIVYSQNINFDGAGCKLATPVFILPEDTIYEPEIVRYFITEVEFAQEYVWVLPNGVQQASGSGGEITTTVNYIDIEIDGSLYGLTDRLKVVAKASVIEQSDTAYTTLPLVLIENLPPVAHFSTNVNSVCAGTVLVITNESTNTNGLSYTWNFGLDASPASSTLSTPPNVSYSSSGTKTISLELRNSSNVMVASYSQDIEVLPLPEIASIIIPQSCDGVNSQISINLTGTAPYVLSYRLNGGTLVNETITSNTYTRQIASTDELLIQTLRDNSCTATISQTIVADIYPAFTATISGDASIYEGETSDLQIIFTGTSPWSITLSDGQTFNNITSSPLSISVTEAATYTITSTSDAHCAGQSLGSATISYIGFEYAVISGNDEVCPGENGTLSLALEGMAPWNVTIAGVGGQETITGITTSPYSFSTALTGNVTLVSASDGENKSLEVNGFGEITVRDTASVVSVSDETICLGDNTDVAIEIQGGTTPWSVSVSDGLNTTIYPITSASAQIGSFEVGNYTIVAVSDAYCTSSSSVIFSVASLPIPTAVISGDAIIVQGETANLTINFTGTAPFSILLNDGTLYSDINTSTYSIPKTLANIYTISSVSDALCTGTTSGSATIEYSDVPTATLSGGGAVCSGIALPSVNVAFTGNEPWMLAFERNGIADTLRNISESSIIIPTVANVTITLISVFDVNNIEGIASGSVSVSVKEGPNLGGNRIIEHCFDEEPQLMVVPDSGFVEYKIEQSIETNPLVQFTEPGYLAYSVSENNCESFDTVFVTDGCTSKFAIPEAFSPNGDGLNDYLRIFGHHFEIIEFIVVNKCGEQVFRATDNALRWDGNYHDSPAPDGTYTWQAHYTDSEGLKKSVNGKVVLTR